MCAPVAWSSRQAAQPATSLLADAAGNFIDGTKRVAFRVSPPGSANASRLADLFRYMQLTLAPISLEPPKAAQAPLCCQPSGDHVSGAEPKEARLSQRFRHSQHRLIVQANLCTLWHRFPCEHHTSAVGHVPPPRV